MDQRKKYLILPLLLAYIFAVTGASAKGLCCLKDNPMKHDSKMSVDCCLPAEHHPDKTADLSTCCIHSAMVLKNIYHQISAETNPGFQLHFHLSDLLAFNRLKSFSFLCLSKRKNSESNAPPPYGGQIPLYKLYQRFNYYG